MNIAVRMNDNSTTSRWLIGSLVLHAVLAGALIATGMFNPFHHDKWGENSQMAGAIQASMVSSLPLAPRQNYQDKGVLTSEQPSPAPIQTKTATVEAPKPDAVPIPVKNAKPVKVAEKPTPAVQHPQPVQPTPNKAVTGETAGVQIPQVVVPVEHGTASVNIEDRNFGNRFAWYGRQIQQKVAANWYSGTVDPRSNGKRVTVIFDVTRDGTPTNPRIETGSGSPTLDRSALQAVQRTDGFGPLPAGDHLTVEYSFDYHQ